MILFVGSTYIKTEETPKFNDFHRAYYVHGYRWIKSKKTFSTNKTVLSFAHYVVASQNYQKFMEENGKEG